MADLSTSSALLTAARSDASGNRLGTQNVTITAGGHTSFVASTRFPETAGVSGIFVFQSSSPGIAGLGLRFSSVQYLRVSAHVLLIVWRRGDPPAEGHRSARRSQRDWGLTPQAGADRVDVGTRFEQRVVQRLNAIDARNRVEDDALLLQLIVDGPSGEDDGGDEPAAGGRLAELCATPRWTPQWRLVLQSRLRSVTLSFG